MDRKRFVKLLSLAGVGWPSVAAAFGRQPGGVCADRCRRGERAAQRLDSLGLEVESRTSISVASAPVIVDVEAPELFDYPLVICVGQGAAPGAPSALALLGALHPQRRDDLL